MLTANAANMAQGNGELTAEACYCTAKPIRAVIDQETGSSP